MGPVTVPKYEKTTDPRRMMIHAVLSEAIRTDWENVRGFLPARTATLLIYERGATKAKAHNEGEAEVSIDLPLKDGWYVPDGNPFAIPNGKASNRDNPDALYLYRYQDRSFSGPLGRGLGFNVDNRRDVNANVYWSNDSGVALIGREATAPRVGVPEEKLVDVANPKTLVQRAELLETVAKGLTERLGAVLSVDAHASLIKPILDEAAFLRELAGKIESIQPKA
ncbi:MAG: hypothetical protein ABID61_03225 [Candidatus Micrarchaeota archaeon]